MKSYFFALLLLLPLSCCPVEAQRGSRIDECEMQTSGEEQPSSPGEQKPFSGDVSERVIQAAGITELMKTKAAAYREASCSASKRNGVYVYSTTVNEYSSAPEKLAARIFILGFSDVYLSPGKAAISETSSWLKTFISACHGYDIRVHALRISENATYADITRVDSEVSLVLTYNARVSSSQKFDGISADIEPHTQKDPAICTPWNSTTGYGKGGPNDILLQKTEEILSRAASKLSPCGLELSEAVNCSFQTAFADGKVSHGSVPSFLQSCDCLILMSYFADTSTIWSRSEPSLAAATKPGSVSICLKSKMNDKDSDSLQPKGWNYMLSTCRTLLSNSEKYPSLRGIDQFSYEGIEIMWEWKNDKD